VGQCYSIGKEEVGIREVGKLNRRDRRGGARGDTPLPYIKSRKS
jgi:hypothetical protein